MLRGTYLFGYAFFFTVGIIHISTGSLTPFLLEAFNKTTDDISVIIFFQFTGFLSGVLIAPLMIKKYSTNPWLEKRYLTLQALLSKLK